MPVKKEKQRRRRSDKKYDEKYTKQLLSGIRYKEKLTVEHLCMRWGISRKTYYNWVERYQEFARAHEHGQDHYRAYLMDKMHEGLEGGKVNAAIFQFAATNLMGWSTRSTVEVDQKETIGSITINIIEPPKQQLEHLEDDVIEGEIVPNNVIKLNVNKESN